MKYVYLNNFCCFRWKARLEFIMSDFRDFVIIIGLENENYFFFKLYRMETDPHMMDTQSIAYIQSQ